jgi:aminopeptidase N
MNRRRILAALSVPVVLAACTSTAPGLTTTAPATPTSTIVSQEPTTSAAPTTTTASATPFTARLGIGDSKYPELGNGGYDVTHYTVDLTFDPAAYTIDALVDVEATATESLTAFSLDFAGFNIDTVTVDGVEADFARDEGELIVLMTDTIPEGATFTTAVRYSGTPDPVMSQAAPFLVGWRTDPSGTSYVIGEPDGGRRWLPMNDHPSDKATYTFKITVPEPLAAAANGTLVDRITDLGWSTWVWESPQPMASYLATVVVGELQVVDDSVATDAAGIPIRNFLPADLVATPPPSLETQGEMVTFFSDVFGPYPFDKYGIAVVDDFEGALENQTLSIFSRYFVDSSQMLETVLAHELAHQWFGDSVTLDDWGDVWLNEGFATYAEWLWLEHTRGEAALEATVAGTRSQVAQIDLPPPGNPPADDLFNSNVYNWGALVLHALRTEIGDDAFFETLRSYADQYRYANASTEDFIAVAEDVSGAQLDDLFDTWLYSETVPPLP